MLLMLQSPSGSIGDSGPRWLSCRPPALIITTSRPSTARIASREGVIACLLLCCCLYKRKCEISPPLCVRGLLLPSQASHITSAGDPTFL
ncbi:hypothetical protein GDO81_024173 [Engystomops pustulosus]|uniref:Uncharacterized protein n=1 Tax=Engystomops pustulosus TaxID=76066 RepID=A0AAV6YPK6_ENGPU|nr:hypothetical protein GDO81_024173 [Engystomops pustulosus]